MHAPKQASLKVCEVCVEEEVAARGKVRLSGYRLMVYPKPSQLPLIPL